LSLEPDGSRTARVGARWKRSMSLMPASATADARRLLATRAMRGFADGAVSVLLASYLSDLGFSPLQIGAIITGTLLGSAALTLAAGLAGHHISRKRILIAASALMFATGVGFTGRNRVLAAPPDCDRRHAQSLGGRRERFPAYRAGRDHRNRVGAGPHRHLRALQPLRHIRRGVRGISERAPGRARPA